MKNILRKVRNIWKQSASEIKVNWKLSQRVHGPSQKVKMYMLPALIYVLVLYILVGFIGGALLGIKESPYWFLLFLLPVTSLLSVYIVNYAWTNYYSVFKQEFFERYSIQVPQGE